MQYDYDLIVIGGGSGGVRAARISAGYGAKVAIFEGKKWGGTCVNVGCVPKKLFVYGSKFSHARADGEGFGWTFAAPEFDWTRLIANKNKEIERLNNIYKKILKECDLIESFVGFADEHTVVDSEGKKYTAMHFIIATGSEAVVPDIPGKEHIMTSDACFFLEQLPKSIVINGGGYIGVEFANIFHGFGVEVTLVYRGDLFLRGFDAECRVLIADEMRKNGIDVRFQSNIVKIEANGDGTYSSHLTDGSTLCSEKVMFATGRAPLIHGLNLEKIGVETHKGAIVTDDGCKTNIDHIFAIGDVIAKMALTPVAIREGHALADTLYGNKPRKMNYEEIPTAVFSQPAMGHCGLLESEAVKRYGEIDIYKTKFTPMKFALGTRKEATFYKLIVDRASDRVVGAHIVDSEAGDLIQLLGVCIKAKATKADFDATVGVHPTSAEELVTIRTKAN